MEQDAAVVANTAAISLEEIIPVGVSSSATIAPEQVRMTAMVMVMAMVMAIVMMMVTGIVMVMVMIILIYQ